MTTDDHRPDRPRVFNIGLNKTATTSFDKAMTLLGLRSLHWGGPEVNQLVRDADAAGLPLLANLDQAYDAFSDIGYLARRFVALDGQYPGSRFVMTVRPIEDWLDSRRRHVEKNQRMKETGEYTGNFLVVDIDRWRAEWLDHTAKVRAYFAGRDDFLEIDITAGAGWGPFCELLGLPEPSEPFPWVNKYRPLDVPADGV